jgi:hypothetical protein
VPSQDGTVNVHVCKRHPKRGSDVLEVELSAENLRTAAQAFLKAAEELESLKRKKEEVAER